MIDTDVIGTCSGGLVSNTRGIIGLISSVSMPTEKYEKRKKNYKYYSNVQKTSILEKMFEDHGVGKKSINFTFIL